MPQGRVALRLGPVGRRPAPARNSTPITAKIAQPWRCVADHAAEHVGQRRADRRRSPHLDQVGDRVRVLERMGGVGVEEAAAIGAELLDRYLRGDRALRDRLLGAFERRRVDVGAEVLRHALPDQAQRDDDRQRQQHVERAARQIDPEIADRLAPSGGRSRGSARSPARCRSPPRRNSAR